MSRILRRAARLLSSLAAGAVLLALGSCDTIGSINSTVNITVTEFTVTADRASVPSGRVMFNVTNTGGVDHEFLVIRTDLAPNALPTEADGSYLEDGPGTTLLDEIATIAPGTSQELTLILSDGNYVLICNMTGLAIHYAEGMRTAFAVN